MDREKLQALLKDMSLEEKIMQLVQLPGQTFEEDAAVTGLADMEKAKKLKSLAGSVLGLHGADKIKAIQKFSKKQRRSSLKALKPDIKNQYIVYHKECLCGCMVIKSPLKLVCNVLSISRKLLKEH